MKFSIQDFFSKCEQTHRKLWMYSHLLKKLVMEDLIIWFILPYFALIWLLVLSFQTFMRFFKVRQEWNLFENDVNRTWWEQ